MRIEELDALTNKLDRLANEHKFAVAAVVMEESNLETYKAEWADAKEAQAVFQSVATAVQQDTHNQISTIVTHALRTVFPDGGYSFEIVFEQKRGKTDARMVFVKNGHEVNPTESDSGGVVQVAAFALRLACLMLTTPRRRRLMLLDEPFSGVNAEYMPMLAELLLLLSKKLNMQFVIVTHSPHLQVGKVISLE